MEIERATKMYCRLDHAKMEAQFPRFGQQDTVYLEWPLTGKVHSGCQG